VALPKTRFSRDAALVLILAVCVISIAGCASDPSPGDHQQPLRAAEADEARRDIAAGLLELHTYGLSSPPRTAFARLLQDRLGVHVRDVAGCVIAGDDVKQIEAYNRVMTAEIERRFGPGAVARLRDEAAAPPPATQPST
jgi:hypothetical protein